jgi:hypothetical protein
MTDLQHDQERDAPHRQESSSAASSASTVKEEAASAASTVAEQGKETATTAVEAGSQVAGTAVDSARQVASEAAQQAGEVTRQATEQVRSLAGEAQAQLRAQAGSQAERAATGLRDLGRQMHGLAEGNAQSGLVADAVRQIGDTVDQWAGRIEERGFDGTVEDVRGFAARRPGVFLAGAAAAGFLTVRMSRGLQRANQQEQQQRPPAPEGTDGRGNGSSAGRPAATDGLPRTAPSTTAAEPAPLPSSPIGTTGPGSTPGGFVGPS